MNTADSVPLLKVEFEQPEFYTQLQRCTITRLIQLFPYFDASSIQDAKAFDALFTLDATYAHSALVWLPEGEGILVEGTASHTSLIFSLRLWWECSHHNET